MPTAEEKQAQVAAKQAEVQAVVAQRSRREAGPLGAPKMRAAGDMSRYKVGYTDDPYDIPFTDMSGSAGELPPPEMVEVSPPTSTRTAAPPPPSRRSPQPPPAPTPTTSTRTRPPRTQPGTTNVRTPYGGYRRVSEGKVPQSGALYETNPTTSVTTASARERLAQLQGRNVGRIAYGSGTIGLSRDGSGKKQAGSYRPGPKKAPGAPRRVNVGTSATIGIDSSGKKKAGSYRVTPVKTAKAVAAKKATTTKAARPVSKAVKR